jgi:hypothetical protein
MGGNTLDGIRKAIERGAEVEITAGFKPRNLKVAANTDILLAFTWGEGKEPKDGGTNHTWKHCTAQVKIHVPLGSCRTEDRCSSQYLQENKERQVSE